MQSKLTGVLFVFLGLVVIFHYIWLQLGAVLFVGYHRSSTVQFKSRVVTDSVFLNDSTAANQHISDPVIVFKSLIVLHNYSIATDITPGYDIRANTHHFNPEIQEEPSLVSLLSIALNSLPDPVFVMYGNKGYANLLGNFVCNMALFPAMHRHILIVVGDTDSAMYIKSINDNITVFVASHDLLESYDFASSGYLKLMLARGLFLVDLLGLALMQLKTIIWLEPDFYYSQNLLSRPEMIHTTSDLVFYLDHEMYCGCFIRFAPVPASVEFYKEVMTRMQRIHADGGDTNDQILLNAVVADLSPNFTLFDRCLYRSGTYNTGGFMLEYQRACYGVYPVAQHHNWIIGVEKKIQMAKSNGGWFMSADLSVCRQRDLLLIVMTMNRPRSLKRLMRSIREAQYWPESIIDLKVTVDRDYSGGLILRQWNSCKLFRGRLVFLRWLCGPRRKGCSGSGYTLGQRSSTLRICTRP